MNFEEWKDFKGGEWRHEINVRNFIQRNYTPYEGGAEFLAGPTERTKKLWSEVLELYKKERRHDNLVRPLLPLFSQLLSLEIDKLFKHCI